MTDCKFVHKRKSQIFVHNQQERHTDVMKALEKRANEELHAASDKVHLHAKRH